MGCAEANLFHRGPDIIDGIFFDTGSVRAAEDTDQETEDRDVQAHADTVKFVKNLWRDYQLDREAVVITNVGSSRKCFQITALFTGQTTRPDYLALIFTEICKNMHF